MKISTKLRAAFAGALTLRPAGQRRELRVRCPGRPAQPPVQRLQGLVLPLGRQHRRVRRWQHRSRLHAERGPHRLGELDGCPGRDQPVGDPPGHRRDAFTGVYRFISLKDGRLTSPVVLNTWKAFSLDSAAGDPTAAPPFPT